MRSAAAAVPSKLEVVLGEVGRAPAVPPHGAGCLVDGEHADVWPFFATSIVTDPGRAVASAAVWPGRFALSHPSAAALVWATVGTADPVRVPMGKPTICVIRAHMPLAALP